MKKRYEIFSGILSMSGTGNVDSWLHSTDDLEEARKYFQVFKTMRFLKNELCCYGSARATDYLEINLVDNEQEDDNYLLDSIRVSVMDIK